MCNKLIANIQQRIIVADPDDDPIPSMQCLPENHMEIIKKSWNKARRFCGFIFLYHNQQIFTAFEIAPLIILFRR